jgi:hypothetical protein
VAFLLVVFVACFFIVVVTSEHPTDSSSSSAPIAHREEDRVVYLGVAPPGWDAMVPRQAEDSEFDLMDPPVAIPDPYGWLRRSDAAANDDDDEMDDHTDDDYSSIILEYLHAENNYTQDAYFSKPNVAALQQKMS